MRCVALPWLLAAAAGAAAAEEWSFREFLSGDWDLERHTPGQKTDYAHYSLHAVGANLEGSYYEDGDDGSSNEMVVRVVFDDGHSGQFQLAKLPTPTAVPESEEADTPPTPQPQPEPKTAFDFDFRAQNGGRFHVSDSRWLGTRGGTVQFLVADEDSFVFSKVGTSCADNTTASCSSQMTAWTASRQGASRRKGPAALPRSLLQRYGWYVFFGLLYFGYKAAGEAAAKAAAGMQKKL